MTALIRLPCSYRSPSTCSERGSNASTLPRSTRTLLRSPACWTMPVTTSLSRSLYSSYIILRFADALQDHLLRRLRCDAAEVLGRHVLALHLVLRDVRPVDIEVVIGEQRVRALTVLGLDPLQLLECALARLVEQPLLDVGRKLDRVDAEVPLLVDLDRG